MKVNINKIWIELEKMNEFGENTGVDKPDTNSHIWQTADNMIKLLEKIKRRAIDREKKYNQ